MGGQNSKRNVSTSSMAAGTTKAASSGVIRPRQRISQNFLLIWVDADIDESSKDCQNTLSQLRSVVNDVNIFNQPDQCIQFLNEIQAEKAFVIASGSLGQQLVPDIHALTQLDAIYIFCENKSRHEQWTKQWTKIKGIYTDIKSICLELQQAVKQCNHDSIAVSFVTVSEATSSGNLDQLESSYMYTQIFKEILFDMEHDAKSIKDLAIYCRKFYTNNTADLNIIDEFEHSYRSTLAIWWYTRECFTYQMLNRALRMLESDTIITMGFFIRDLHEQIRQLHQKQVGTYGGKSFTLYRGQGLLKPDFEKLVKTKGGLMSFNNFLSTSNDQDISLGFARGALAKTGTVGILFKMAIDSSVPSTPFASIREDSYFQTEEEVLFSMHTVFRIGEINKIDNNDSLYQVDLKLTADDDQQLHILTKRIREEVMGETGWQRLGMLLVKIGNVGKAEELYNVLLEQTSDEGEKAIYYNQLGYIKNSQGDYEKAIEYFEKRLKIKEETVPSNQAYLAVSYNNIAAAYDNMGEYSKALSSHEKALEIRQKTLPENHPDFAQSYINIGTVYRNLGEYSKALSFYEKSLEIYQKTLPPNHPDLATSYNNIGLVYKNMGEYSKALSFYEKALEIRQKTLPPNHPDFAQSYNNIGGVYYNMEEYSKALSFYEKAREIWEKALPSNHSLVAVSYNNIGEMYRNMEEYSKALPFYEKALEIFEKTLPSNHPLLATTCNNIGLVYYNMENNSKALSYLERAQNIWKSSLPPNHPDIQSVRKSIEIVKKQL